MVLKGTTIMVIISLAWRITIIIRIIAAVILC